MKRSTIFFTLALTGLSVFTFAQTIVKSSDPHISYMGRIAETADSRVLSWPGSSATINFNGTGVKVVLQDERGDNYYNVIVDGKVTAKIHPDAAKNTYVLASGLKKGPHNLQLFKRTEWTMGKTTLYQFELEGKSTVLAPPAPKKHRIEFFGNSITCGYAVEDSSGKDRGSSPYENNYVSYAALTARHFDAAYYCTARSGIGVLISWFPQTMPEMYNLLDGNDPKSTWDFSKYTPELVVVNLFQNDSWLVKQPNHAEFKARFGTIAPTEAQIIKAYADFIKTLCATYPKANIVCALGSMDATATGSPWPGYIDKAVASIGDKRICTHFFACKNTPGHPNGKEQEAMADDLIKFISTKFGW